MGMIERIEVLTDGASAIYGTDAIGGVVNIILKKGYNQTEARLRMGGTWHGGAFERGATLTHGFSSGKLRGTVVLDYFSRRELFATQRAFSKTSDQRARGGDDFRSTIGQPITVLAVAGQTLVGLTNPNGTAATQAVAPLGQDGRSLTVARVRPRGRAAGLLRWQRPLFAHHADRTERADHGFRIRTQPPDHLLQRSLLHAGRHDLAGQSALDRQRHRHPNSGDTSLQSIQTTAALQPCPRRAGVRANLSRRPTVCAPS
jgi:outer membrane receptor protein involved in Fe transport